MKPFSSKKKVCARKCKPTTATKKIALLVYCSVSHYYTTSKYSFYCRERPEVPRLVTLADNMKVPLDVDFSVLFPLVPIWRSVVNSHSQQESSSIIKHTIVDLININV